MATKRVRWDEAALAEHRRCAGVLYGAQRIEESLTPFLYYSESVSRGEGAIGEFVVGAGRTQVSIDALQERLGVLAFAQSEGAQLRSAAVEELPLPPAPWLLLQSRSEPGEHFYFNPTTREASWVLPDGAADDARAHEDRADVVARVEAGADASASADVRARDDRAEGELELAAAVAAAEDDDEEVPLPQSRLASATDCAAAYAHRRARGHTPLGVG